MPGPDSQPRTVRRRGADQPSSPKLSSSWRQRPQSPPGVCIAASEGAGAGRNAALRPQSEGACGVVAQTVYSPCRFQRASLGGGHNQARRKASRPTIRGSWRRARMSRGRCPPSLVSKAGGGERSRAPGSSTAVASLTLRAGGLRLPSQLAAGSSSCTCDVICPPRDEAGRDRGNRGVATLRRGAFPAPRQRQCFGDPAV